MRASLAVVAALLLNVLVCSGAALAQEPSSSVTFDAVSFTFDHTLGTSVSIVDVPGQPTNVDGPGGPEVPHLAFTLVHPQSESMKVPKASVAPSVIRFYPTADLADYARTATELDALTALLAERPDLASYMAVSADGSGETLPYLPIVPAAQVIRARAEYVDTPELAGVAYVTAFRQDVSPFAAADFWYTFQGLSADGDWYIAADFVVDASAFPDEPSAKETRRISDPTRYAEYLEESVGTLNGAPPDAFTPVLTSIDALVRSIEIADATTGE